MGKISGTLWLLGALIGVAIIVSISAQLQDSKDDAKLRFDARSEHAVVLVEACLFEGKGGEVFRRMQAIPIRLGNQANDRTYTGGGEKRLVLVGSGGGTRITFRSTVPATSEELDILDWCATNPELTWIPQKLR